jgi:hypothetical protein
LSENGTPTSLIPTIPSKAISEAEFIDELQTTNPTQHANYTISSICDDLSENGTPTSLNPTIYSKTITELLDWKNANAIVFNNNGGVVWVSPEYAHLLTPAWEQAIREHQDTLSVFADAYADVVIEDATDTLLEDTVDLDALCPECDDEGKDTLAELFDAIGRKTRRSK